MIQRLILCVFVSISMVACGGTDDDPDGDGNSVQWATTRVSLAADDFYFHIPITDKTFYAKTADLVVRSDPGDATSCTLELRWVEHGVQMKLNIYFESDGNAWWSREIRHYTGEAGAGWLYYRKGAPYFKAPLGTPFQGDVDLTDDNDLAKLHLGKLKLRAFL
jgi:hypothetical protein